VSKLKLFSLLLFLLLSITVNSANAQAQRDVVYVEHGTFQKLDLFVPPNVVSPPVVLYIHGGGWLTGDKNDVPQFLFKTGYAVAAINMRPTSVARFPAQIDDCISALHWLQENAKRYGYSGDNVIVVGISSGAHLAALMGTMQYPGREAVKCVVDVSGPVNFLSIVAHAHPTVPGQVYFCSPKGHIAALIGGPPLKKQDAALKASPITYTDAKSAPVLIIHGGMDEIVPYEQANEFHRRLDVFGVKNDLVILPNAAHNMAPDLWSPVFSMFVSRYVPRPKRVAMNRQPGGPGQPNRSGQSGQPMQPGQPQSVQPGQPTQPGQSGPQAQSGQSGKTQPGQAAQSGQPGQTAQSGQPGQSTQSGQSSQSGQPGSSSQPVSSTQSAQSAPPSDQGFRARHNRAVQ
jgi:acetyl esterase/lipase